MTTAGEATGGVPGMTAPRGAAGAGPVAETARDAAGAAAASAGGPAPSRRARIEGLLLGLAAGDAAGWPAARHRAARMPEWTRRLTRELDTFAEQNATTTLPVP
ncbi:ADP-ribosylglycohydrolase family protein, partial [Streptomyces anulatus]